MLDTMTLTISLGGILLTIVYAVLITFAHARRQEEIPSLKEKIDRNLQKTSKADAVLKDYEVSCSELQRRDNITLLIGSLLITGSILILAEAISVVESIRPIFALTSIGMVLLWLLAIHLTSKMLDELSYPRIRTIERALTQHLGYPFGIHHYVWEETRRTMWIRFRRLFWSYVSFLLCLAWAWLSCQSTCVAALLLPIVVLTFACAVVLIAVCTC